MNTDSPSNIDWGLDEPLRFPVTASGWKSLKAIPLVLRDETNWTNEKYAQVLNPRTSAETVKTVSRLIEIIPDDFEAAAAAITVKDGVKTFSNGYTLPANNGYTMPASGYTQSAPVTETVVNGVKVLSNGYPRNR